MSNHHYNDPTCHRLSDGIRLAEPELRALGDRVSTDLDAFIDVQERYLAKVAEHEALLVLVRQLAITRHAHRAVLVEALQAAWEKVPSTGTVGRRKPASQVEQERRLLFPSGRPTVTMPGDHALLLGTDALVSALTTDSVLARAWSAENLAAISNARDAVAPAWEEWKQATYRRSVVMTELETLRMEWYDKLRLLRDEVKSAYRRLKLPNRFASLFRYRKPRPTQPEQPPPTTE